MYLSSKFLYPVTSSSWMSQRPLKCNMARPDSSYPRCLSAPPPNLRKSIQTPRNTRVISLSHSAYQIHHHIPSILFLNCFTISFMSLLFTATTKSNHPHPSPGPWQHLSAGLLTSMFAPSYFNVSHAQHRSLASCYAVMIPPLPASQNRERNHLL